MTSRGAAERARRPRAPLDAGRLNQLIWWMVLLKVGIVFVFLLLTTMFMIWLERRLVGRMQNHPGPNRAGPFGLLQPIADALKLPLKKGSGLIPRTSDKLVFIAAPILCGDARLHQLRDDPVGPRGVDLPSPHPAAARRHAGRGAAGARDEFDRRVRDRAGRLGLGVAVLAARRAALRRAGDQLRDRDGAGVRGRVPVRGLAVHHRDRQRPAARVVLRGCWPSRSSSTCSPWSARPTGCRSTCPRARANWWPGTTPSTRR